MGFIDGLISPIADGGLLLTTAVVVAICAGAALYWTAKQSRLLESAISRSSYEQVHAGREVNDYFSADAFLGAPENVRHTAAWLKETIKGAERAAGARVDRLVFLEREDGPVGAISLKDLTTYLTGIPSVVLRPSEINTPEFFFAGQRFLVEGKYRPILPGERVLVISDVATSGGSLVHAVQSIRNLRAQTVAALVLYDREEGAAEALRSHGVPLLAQIAASQVRHAEESSRRAA